MGAPPLEPVLTYAAALLLGAVAMLLVLPPEVLLGGGAGWTQAEPAQALAGHLAFQADRWRWPVLETLRLFAPRGVPLAFVDGNPLVSLLAKAWTRGWAVAPQNWLGAFVGLCWVLQPAAAVYAARGLRVTWWAALAAGVLACAWPAWLFHATSVSLHAHGLVLVALGLCFRRIERPLGWGAPGALLVVAVLIQPELFQLCAAVLLAVPLHAALCRRAGWRRDAACYAVAVAFAVGVLAACTGGLGRGLWRFDAFSMNLGSPLWPQRSGVFGSALPLLDGTGGQHEGFAWLGAGTLLLLLVGAAAAGVRRAWPRPGLALVAVLAALALTSLGSRWFAGPTQVLDMAGDGRVWDGVFDTFRMAGRAFWPVGYALMLGGVAAADRLSREGASMGRRLMGPALLAVALGLQGADVVPLVQDARAAWRREVAVPAVPGGTTLFTAVPAPGCTPTSHRVNDAADTLSAAMLLQAARQGAELGDIGLSRAPAGFDCTRVVSDALELPLRPGEVRAFAGRQMQAPLRPALMGPQAVCRRVAGDVDVVLCAAGVASFAGEAVAGPEPPPAVALPFTAGADGLAWVLGSGWRVGLGGSGAWSEGSRSTLVMPVPAGAGLELRLRASGIAARSGAGRVVTVTVGRTAVGQFTLPDGLPTEVAVAVPPSTIADGFLRVALDVSGPVDPTLRGLSAPVQRAAILLTGVSLRVE